jgi:hypothetical protein
VSKYLQRIVDIELDELIGGAPAIALEGPKGIGKTASLLRRANTAYAIDDPRQRVLLEADPERLSEDAPPILLDESPPTIVSSMPPLRVPQKSRRAKQLKHTDKPFPTSGYWSHFPPGFPVERP